MKPWVKTITSHTNEAEAKKLVVIASKPTINKVLTETSASRSIVSHSMNSWTSF